METASRLRNFIAIFSLIGMTIRIKPASAESNLTEPYDNLFLLVTILSILVGVGVVVLWIYFMIKFRETNEAVDRVPLSHDSANKLELAWTGVAIFIVILLMIVSYPVLLDLDTTSANTDYDQEVVILGTQFTWLYWNGTQYTSSLTINLTEGNTVRFTVSSNDVIHSFFVPELSFKLDANPGSNNSIVVTIDKAGTYDVLCNQFCGVSHSEMRSSFTVIEG